MEEGLIKRLKEGLRELDDSILNHVVNSLREPGFKEYRKKVATTFDDIFKILQRESNHKLDRCRLVGGLGKATSISLKSDADLAIFYNGNQSRRDVMEDFKRVLCSITNVSDLKINGMGNLQFTYHEIPIDLIAAKNRYEGTLKNKIAEQRNESIRNFRENKEEIDAKSIRKLSYEPHINMGSKEEEKIHMSGVRRISPYGHIS